MTVDLYVRTQGVVKRNQRSNCLHLWSRLPCTPPGNLPNPGTKPRSPALKVDSLPSELPGKPMEKAREFQKSSSASLTMLKPLTVWITTNCRKFLKRWEYQTTLPVSCETCMQGRKQELDTDMEQQTGSKLGKGYIKEHIFTLLI